jgi:AcrR family transcriptional regulator
MSSPSTLSLRERKKIDTRERLLAAANELFVARGYDATTMDEIAARADVSRATAFNYFPRKDDFLRTWIDGRRRAIAQRLTAEQERPISTADRLRHALMALCDMLEENALSSRALIRAWVRAGGQLQQDASATAVVFAKTIRFGQAQGDIRPDIDPDATGRVLLDGYAGAVIRWSSEPEQMDDGLKGAVAAALDVVLTGIQAPAAAS